MRPALLGYPSALQGSYHLYSLEATASEQDGKPGKSWLLRAHSVIILQHKTMDSKIQEAEVGTEINKAGSTAEDLAPKSRHGSDISTLRYFR